MNDKHFTHDEVSLMSIYNAAGTREGLIAALTEMRGYHAGFGQSVIRRKSDR